MLPVIGEEFEVVNNPPKPDDAEGDDVEMAENSQISGSGSQHSDDSTSYEEFI